MKKNSIVYLIVQIALVLTGFLPVMSAPVMPGRDDRSIPLVPYLEMLEDKEERLTINDMLDSGVHKDFRHLRVGDTNYGYTDSSFWLRFSIDPSGLQGIDHAEYFIEVGYPLYDMVEIYVFDSAGGLDLMRAGDKLPFANRIIPSRNFVFPLTLRAGYKADRLHPYSNERGIPASSCACTFGLLYPERAGVLFAFGIFYGILLIMGIASILLFFIEMDRLYLYYTAFIASIILWHASLDGLAFQFLWPGSPWWANKCIPFFMLLVVGDHYSFYENLSFHEDDRASLRQAAGIHAGNQCRRIGRYFRDTLYTSRSRRPLCTLPGLRRCSCWRVSITSSGVTGLPGSFPGRSPFFFSVRSLSR